MAVIVEGIEMPQNCKDCAFRTFDAEGDRVCFITYDEIDGIDHTKERMWFCPLKEPEISNAMT